MLKWSNFASMRRKLWYLLFEMESSRSEYHVKLFLCFVACECGKIDVDICLKVGIPLKIFFSLYSVHEDISLLDTDDSD